MLQNGKSMGTLEMVKIDNEKDNKPLSQLIQAVKEGNVTVLEKLLNNGADPFEEDEGKRTILHHAAGLDKSSQSYECAKVILESVPSSENRKQLVNKLDKKKRSPLYWAAIKGNSETISLLLQNSAEIYVLDVGNESVLHAAARCENHSAALESARKICISANLKPDSDFLNIKSSEDNYYRTCLHLAVLNGNEFLVKYLIENGASLKEVDEFSYNSIHLAIQNREPQKAVNLCRILLGSDIDKSFNISELIEQKDMWERTPLHLSARQGNSEIIDLLIGVGADVTQKDKNSNTALHLAANLGSEEKAENSVKCLLQNNLDTISQHKFVNIQNNKGQTALYIAAKNFNGKAAEKLLLTGSQYDIQTEKKKTPLEKVYRNVPSALTVLLDEAVKNSGYSVRDGVISNYAKIDFGPILGRSLANPSKIYQETEELAKICHADIEKRQPVLSHTFVKIFIWKKWEKVGWCFYLSRIFHLIWYMFCLVYLLKVYRETCPFNSPKNDTIQFSLSAISPPEDTEGPFKVSLDQCDFSGFPFYGGILILIGSIVVLLGEVYPTYQRFHWYYRPIKNFTLGSAPKKILQIAKFTYDVLPLTQIIIFLLACLTSPPLFGIFPLPDLHHFALVAGFAFTTCVCMYLELGKFPGFRVYVNLLRKISSSLFCAILVHFPILVGFAVVFVFLLQGMPSFSSLPQAIVKVLTLSIGELDYQSVIYDGLLLFKGIEMLAFGVFVIFITVVLINFLVGLATDDVKESREKRKVAWKLCTQIEQIFLLESFLDVCGLWIGKYILKNYILLMPPIERGQIRRTVELYIPSLPKDLQKELHNLNLKIILNE